ncbi:MAG: hypothetical protein PHH01_05285, partial [Patescibacteria group bacterium]|nr:hypothetical protein [Patescibacteria group bacterium]
QLQMPLVKEAGEVDYIYWTGCASVYDERARSITRAVSVLSFFIQKLLISRLQYSFRRINLLTF